MAKIKTRDAVKGTIKAIDKAAVASERMKAAYAKTKEKAEQVSYASERIAGEGAHQLNRQGQKSVQTTKENIIKAKDKVEDFKGKRAVKTAEKQKAQAAAERNGSQPHHGAASRSPAPEEPLYQDKAAGKADHQDHRPKCRKDGKIHRPRHGKNERSRQSRCPRCGKIKRSRQSCHKEYGQNCGERHQDRPDHL